MVTPKQFRFRPGYSTSLAPIALTDQVKRSIDDGKLVGSVFVDPTKAFYPINHHILFGKQASLDIVRPLLQLLRNDLLKSVLVISVSGVISAKKQLTSAYHKGQYWNLYYF